MTEKMKKFFFGIGAILLFLLTIFGGIALYIWTILIARQNFGGGFVYYVPFYNVFFVTWKAWQREWWWYVIPAVVWMLLGTAFIFFDDKDSPSKGDTS